MRALLRHTKEKERLTFSLRQFFLQTNYYDWTKMQVTHGSRNFRYCNFRTRSRSLLFDSHFYHDTENPRYYIVISYSCSFLTTTFCIQPENYYEEALKTITVPRQARLFRNGRVFLWILLKAHYIICAPVSGKLGVRGYQYGKNRFDAQGRRVERKKQ